MIRGENRGRQPPLIRPPRRNGRGGHRPPQKGTSKVTAVRYHQADVPADAGAEIIPENRLMPSRARGYPRITSGVPAMRLALYTASGLMLSGAGYLAVAGSRPPAAPVAPVVAALTIEPARHDFGEVSRDQIVTAKFVVRNTHPVPVTVGPITKGCSCSEAVVEPETIPPGGTGELSVSWQLRGKRGKSTEAVSVAYTGPGRINGFALAQVFATVYGPINPDKEVLGLSRENPVGEVVFSARDGRPFKTTQATANHPSLTATVDPDGRRVRVVFDPAVTGWESGRLWLNIGADRPNECVVSLEVAINR